MKLHTPIHAYGGIEHSQPGPFDECLLCQLDEVQTTNGQMAAFIGHKGLGDEYVAWVLNRREEINILLNDGEAGS